MTIPLDLQRAGVLRTKQRFPDVAERHIASSSNAASFHSTLRSSRTFPTSGWPTPAPTRSLSATSSRTHRVCQTSRTAAGIDRSTTIARSNGTSEVATVTLRSAPGATYAYSNLAFEVLGDVIGKASRMPFEDYVQKEILAPLEMRSSTLLYDGMALQAWAAGNTRTAAGAMTVIPHYPYNRAHAPSSTLHSSASDMSRWMLAMLNGGELDGRRILQKASLDEMWTRQWRLVRAGSASRHGGGDFVLQFSGRRARRAIAWVPSLAAILGEPCAPAAGRACLVRARRGFVAG